MLVKLIIARKLTRGDQNKCAFCLASLMVKKHLLPSKWNTIRILHDLLLLTIQKAWQRKVVLIIFSKKVKDYYYLPSKTGLPFTGKICGSIYSEKFKRNRHCFNCTICLLDILNLFRGLGLTLLGRMRIAMN